jgi:hypothetical protein
MRLGKRYSSDRLAAACKRAIAIGACSYKSIESILKNDRDRQPLPKQAETAIPDVHHSNVRGANYYR